MSEQKDICYLRSVEEPRGVFLPKEKARISPDDRGFYFADGVYEVIRTYFGRFFRLQEHLSRFKNSLAAVRIELPDFSRIPEIAWELLKQNKLEKRDAFIYIQVTRGCWQRNLLFPPKEIIPTLYISVTPIIPPEEEQRKGILAITVPDIRWQRCDIKSIGLLPSVLARQLAYEQNAQEAIFVRNGFLTEGTHTNLFVVKNGTVFTHPLNNHILPGITRSVVLELCRELNLPVSETAVSESELSQVEEVFVTSTTWEIMPVIKINQQTIGLDKPGRITLCLQKEFREYILKFSAPVARSGIV
ncbi:MAG: D-amino-acid transaminase [candidate division WOR-3 bacterium]